MINSEDPKNMIKEEITQLEILRIFLLYCYKNKKKDKTNVSKDISN